MDVSTSWRKRVFSDTSERIVAEASIQHVLVGRRRPAHGGEGVAVDVGILQSEADLTPGARIESVPEARAQLGQEARIARTGKRRALDLATRIVGQSIAVADGAVGGAVVMLLAAKGPEVEVMGRMVGHAEKPDCLADRLDLSAGGEGGVGV